MIKIKEETYMHLSLSLSTPVIFILSRHNLILIVAYAGIQCSTSQFMSSFDLKTRSNMNIFLNIIYISHNNCTYFVKEDLTLLGSIHFVFE